MIINIIKTNSIKILLLFSVLITGLSIVSCTTYEKSEESESYLNNPKVGDLYFIENESDVFTLFKVKSVSEETIDFTTNSYNKSTKGYMDESYGYIKFKRTEELNDDLFWSDSIATYKRDKVRKLYDDNVIFDIKRY